MIRKAVYPVFALILFVFTIPLPALAMDMGVQSTARLSPISIEESLIGLRFDQSPFVITPKAGFGIEDRDSNEVFAEFPEDISTPELNVEVTEETKFTIIENLGQKGDFGDGNINTIDGVRVEYSDGWGLCRASNTTPMLVLRFEAESDEALERIKAVFREQLAKVAPDLVADF